ncbi:MAG: ATP-binding protein [Deltaproteobacteria bacterium]|nr:ATP-binding protein [Deltaproteobacteria bacterium]
MKYYKIRENRTFVGRRREQELLRSIMARNESAMVVVHGRRRVGKTELIEQTFRMRNVLKFEGLEGRTENDQREAVLEQLAEYLEQPILRKVKVTSWREIFKLIAEATEHGEFTIYLEELQWLANYKDELVSDLKYVWDNYFRKNNGLILILCGSAPSFMVNKVLHSSALYNRSQYEVALQEFSLVEVREFLGDKISAQEVMDAYLSVGGMPEYLKYMHTGSSIFLSLCKQSFLRDGFFLNEYKRVFTSSLASNKHYKTIIEFLAQRKYASRSDIAKHLKIKPGGTLSELLENLELSGFIQKYAPYNLGQDSKLARYAIADNYLQFYFKFIKPRRSEIVSNMFETNPSAALNVASYQKWLGFSFERFCRKYKWVLANILGFGAVRYRSGVYFRKEKADSRGFQIDLLYERDDKVVTVCEMKYLQSKCRASVIDEMERKLALLEIPSSRTIQKVLVTTIGADESLIRRAYFDRVITLDELMNPVYCGSPY